MSSPPKNYDAARRERARKTGRKDPVKFALGELVNDGGHIVHPAHEFTIVDVIPLGESFDLMDAPEPITNYEQSARACEKFIRSILIDEDVPIWDRLLRRKKDPIDDITLVEIATDLAEAVAGRHFQQSTDSSSSQVVGGKDSKSGRSKRTSGISAA